MILPESRSLAWIEETAKNNNAKDITLVEKTIRAFSLLEALARSGMEFCFKGGSCLLLHLGSARRMSIDVDVICPPGTEIEKYLEKYSDEYGFSSVESIERQYRTNVPKTHAKYFYQVAYKTKTQNDKILLDVLFEDNKYQHLERLPIVSPFLKTDDNPVLVTVPSKADLLGDKLTAFAPHTTGIPFYKGEKNCSMEIMKQMYDVASLFDVVDDFQAASSTYEKLAKLELEYRGRNDVPLEDVAMDTIEAAQCISTYGYDGMDDFNFYSEGIERVRNFIHSEKYNVPSAIRKAAKAAYAAACLVKNVESPVRFDGDVQRVQTLVVENPLSTKLNKLKKTNPEAFFYWSQTSKILNSMK